MDTQGKNILTKGNSTKDPKSYQPITCFSTICKIFTSVLTDKTCSHLEKEGLFPLKQNGCRRGQHGYTHKLITDKMLLGNYNKIKGNLSSGWIDYKTAFDSVPHK